MKEFADDNFKFDENGRKIFKWVGNTVGKGEIARYEQFLLFPQCFQKACFPGASKGVIVWEWVNLPLYFYLHNAMNLDKSKTFPYFRVITPFLDDRILVLSNMKEFADDNFIVH